MMPALTGINPDIIASTGPLRRSNSSDSVASTTSIAAASVATPGGGSPLVLMDGAVNSAVAAMDTPEETPAVVGLDLDEDC